jgi:hypothetical protein
VGVDHLDKTLDEAQQLGLDRYRRHLARATSGHGFSYHDAKQVDEQLQRARASIERYKDHPAVLIWGIGNEMEGGGDNPAIWAAIEAIAKAAKEIDPNHPTMTVIAELGEESKKAVAIHKFCPSIDIIGINSYGGARASRAIPQGGRHQAVHHHRVRPQRILGRRQDVLGRRRSSRSALPKARRIARRTSNRFSPSAGSFVLAVTPSSGATSRK